MIDEKNEALRQEALLETLLHLPRHILTHYDKTELAPLVLHSLGHDLGLKRASYLVDNPDFDCLKGVAGYCKHECSLHKPDIWLDPNSFSDHMQQAPFHNKIQQYTHASLKGEKNDYEKAVSELARDFGIENPHVRVWDLRHDNHGILIFEEDESDHRQKNAQVLDSLIALLGFCPVKA